MPMCTVLVVCELGMGVSLCVAIWEVCGWITKFSWYAYVTWYLIIYLNTPLHTLIFLFLSLTMLMALV